MKDIKITNQKISRTVEVKNTKISFASISAVSTKVPQAIYGYLMLGLFVGSIATYVTGMVGISIVAISERNYSFKTGQIRMEATKTYTTSASEDTLALSTLNLNGQNVSHVYLFEQPTSAMSSR